jgi:hypothetical protein
MERALDVLLMLKDALLRVVQLRDICGAAQPDSPDKSMKCAAITTQVTVSSWHPFW